jgi:RimJ/RimL family protein N-acetyltransferase
LSQAIEFPVEGIGHGEIRLRLMAEADLDEVIEVVQDPEIPRWTRVPSPYGRAEAEEWLSHQARAREQGVLLNLMVVDGDDRILGSCGITDIDWAEGRCELGYWLARDARGRGVMTGAVRMLSKWVFESLPVERISITAEPENGASRAVAERAGFTYEGVLRSWHVNKGVRRDVAIYSLIRGELPS